MKEILSALGIITIVVVLFSIVPLLGDTLEGDPIMATGRMSFVDCTTITDGETTTIGSTTLEFDLIGDGVTPGNIAVTVSDNSLDTASTNLTATINNDATLSALVTAVRSP